METIESRRKGLINLVRVYREYTSIPTSVLSDLPVQELIEDVLILLKRDLMLEYVEVKIEIVTPGLTLTADQQQIQMILINLIKNACDSSQNQQRSPYLFNPV